MMCSTLHLTVTTPAQILVDTGDVAAVRAEDETGSFGILPGHADLLTVLVPSVVRWRTTDGAARFCAVHEGVFTVTAGRNVAVACRPMISFVDWSKPRDCRWRQPRPGRVALPRPIRSETNPLHPLDPPVGRKTIGQENGLRQLLRSVAGWFRSRHGVQ
jgi:F-type H+-transporting ATPase subunit epsilon